MKEIELLDVIGGVRDRYLLDAQQCRENKVTRRRSPVKIVLVAAIVAALLAGCAYAVLRLQDLKMGEWTPTRIVQPWETAPAEPPQDVISLQGYAGSTNYLAAKEWFEFCENYDPDGALMDEADRTGYRAPEDFSYYSCYTQEMVDKVNEICQKYGLKPMGKLWQEDKTEYIYQALGIEDVTGQSRQISNPADYGFYCADGTFHLSGEFKSAQIEGSGGVYYDFNSLKKKSFSSGYTMISSIEDFEQWEYITADGTNVLLARSPSRGLILSDREDSFESVSITAFLNDMVDRKTLELIADSFDFTFQTKPVDREAADARFQQYLEELEARAQAEREAMKDKNPFPVHSSYQEKIQEWLDNGNKSDFYYALWDLNGDGEPELLFGSKKSMDEGKGMAGVYTIVDGQMKLLLSDGTDQGYYPCAGKVIEYDCSFEKYESRAFYSFDGFIPTSDCYAEPFARLDYFAEPDQYRKDLDGDMIFETVLTDDEVQNILDQYPRVKLLWKPIAEFPME